MSMKLMLILKLLVITCKKLTLVIKSRAAQTNTTLFVHYKFFLSLLFAVKQSINLVKLLESSK